MQLLNVKIVIKEGGRGVPDSVYFMYVYLNALYI